MNKTQLILEHDQYKVLAARDCNNFVGELLEEGIKQKGAFEVDKDWHKDPSFRIIPLALQEYFINDKPIREFVNNHNDIFDFCGRVKSNSGYKIKYHYLKDGREEIVNLQKTNRVYLSNKGGYLYKSKGDRSYAIYKAEKVTVFNQYVEKDDYDINRQWYIKEIQKIIDILEPKQLNLF